MTTSTQTSIKEFSQIGQSPLVKTASIPGQILSFDFSRPALPPIKGAISLQSTLDRLMAIPGFKEKLPLARAGIATKFYQEEKESFSYLRLHAGMSQADLAHKAETSQSYIAKIEAGITDPGTEAIAKIAAALGIEEDLLFRAIRNQRKTRSITK